jgi:hypothetical protein
MATGKAADRLASAVRIMPSARAKQPDDAPARKPAAVPQGWAANYEGSPSY